MKARLTWTDKAGIVESTTLPLLDALREGERLSHRFSIELVELCWLRIFRLTWRS